MGQRRQEQDDDNQGISDMSSADQRPQSDSADTDAAAKQKLLQKIKLSGNFHTYREMKLKQLQEKRSDDTTVTASTTADDNVGQSSKDDDSWNHFITPLKPIISSPAATITSEETKSTIKEEETTTITQMQKSVFTDMERTQTIDRFGNIFMNQMGNVMTSGKLTSAWGNVSDDDGNKSQRSSTSMFSWLFVDYSPNATKKQHHQRATMINPNDYAAERRMITPHLTPFVWGTSCVAVTLASMRLGRWYQGRSLGRAATSSSSSSSLYNRSNCTTTSTIERNRLHDLRSNKSSPQSYGHYNTNRNIGNHPSSYQKNALLSNLSTLPVDLAISLLVGISTSIFLTRPEDLLQDVSKAPLLPGKSVLREELCPSFTQEMDIINRGYHTYTPSDADEKQIVSFQDIWKDENIGDFATLEAIRDFVANCHRAKNEDKDEEQ